MNGRGFYFSSRMQQRAADTVNVGVCVYAIVIDVQVRCASITISLARGPMMYSSHTQIVTNFSISIN